jgi:predicted HicB family RNase H-like nuclease
MKVAKDVTIKKDQIFISRINGRLKAKLAEAAKRQGLTMSELVEQLVKKELKSKSLLPKY